MEMEMHFLNGLVHRAARKDRKEHKGRRLEWLGRLRDKVKERVGTAVEWLHGLRSRATRKDDEERARKALEWLDEPDRPDLSLSLTPQQNTALHIAVTFQQVELAKKIINLCTTLVLRQNSKGDNPLHTAAKAGHLDLTRLLVNEAKAGSDLEQGHVVLLGEMLKMRNSEGYIPFHEALRKGHEEVALYLLDLDEELARIVSNKGESPLYLAAEALLGDVVSKLLEVPEFSIEGPDGQTPLHITVIKSRKKTKKGDCSEIVSTLLEHRERINVNQVDCFGKTALHYAAALGHRKSLAKLVSETPSLVYVPDFDGNSPLHIIAIRGIKFQMVEDILDSNPCAAELLDRNGRNALHLAVMNGNRFTLRFLLRQTEFKVLINEPDGEGNTPLHLAVKLHHYHIVRLLVNMGADLSVTNKEGLTALDICQFYRGFTFTQRFIYRKLISSRADNGRLAWVEKIPYSVRHPLEHPSNDLRTMANTMSIVATLVATVTFAAAFTFPGGYKNGGPEEGLPVFIRKAALKVFLVSDTMAFCSSMIVAFLLVWAMLGDRGYLRKAVGLSLNFSWVAVSATVVAFTTALYVVLSDESLWLAIAVICMGCSVPLLVIQYFRDSARHSPRSNKFLHKIISP